MMTYLSHPLWKLIGFGQALWAFGWASQYATSFFSFIGIMAAWVGIFIVIDAIIMHFMKHPAVIENPIDVSPIVKNAPTGPFVPIPPEAPTHPLHVVEDGKEV